MKLLIKGDFIMKYFVQKGFTATFQDKENCKLLYVSKTDDDFIKTPYATHMHEDCLEILFIRHGVGIHTIAGKRYEIKKGDILIHNSKVLHNHDINFDSKMSVYSCAVSNVKIEGLSENSLIPDNTNPILQSGIFRKDIEILFSIMYSQINSQNKGYQEIGNHLACSLISMIVNQITPIKNMKIARNILQ